MSINVALVNPPITGHGVRGTGKYFNELYSAIQSIEDISLSRVDYGKDLSNFDLVHYPYFDPFFLTLPIVKKVPTIVTVHDLIPLTFPGNFPRGVRGTVKWWIQRFSLSKATAIMTDSYDSKKDICHFTSVNPAFVHVIYLGVGMEFKNKKKKCKPQILYVGDVNYNKNIPTFIRAFLIVTQRFADWELILVGKGFTDKSFQLNEVTTLIEKSAVKRSVHLRGFVSTSELVDLYNTSSLYVQPSLKEGFGLPVLEAFACGCPVVASGGSSLVEVGGNACEYVNPKSEADIARGMMKVISSSQYSDDLKKRGLERARSFTWEKTAVQVADVYTKVMSKL